MSNEELIQNYIANRLSADEKIRVEKLLATNGELQELYATHQEMAAAFQLANANAIKERLQTLDAEVETSNNKSFWQTKWSRIVAAAIVIVGVFFMINTLRSGDLYESYFEICPNTYLPVTRGSDVNDIKFEAFKAYENNDFQTAVTHFEALLKTSDDPNIRFYYSMSLLNQKQFDAAFTVLQKLHTVPFDYQTESLWYTALIQLQKNEHELAKQALLKVQKLNPDFKSEEIKTILKQL